MSDLTGIEQKPRGRPRSEKGHQAILAAAAELLLAEGLQAVSMDRVAERAGVSKATIYRWWPTVETLALVALCQEWDTGHDPRPTRDRSEAIFSRSSGRGSAASARAPMAGSSPR